MKTSAYSAIFALTLLPGLALAVGQTTLVSVNNLGEQGNLGSSAPSFSADGRYVAFISNSNNLVTGSSNGSYGVFVRDRQTGQTTRVSVDSAGMEGNGSCANPVLSADGRFVAFESDASNLVAGDSNGLRDIFVHDRLTGKTERVSVGSAGEQGNWLSRNPTLSADGRFVVFESYADTLDAGDTNGFVDVFIHDRQTGQTTRVSVDSAGGQANGESMWPYLSADGRYVAFTSDATNLIGGSSNGLSHIFVHDRQTKQTSLVSVDNAGVQGNGHSIHSSLSADGHYVVFRSDADNLVTGDTNGYEDVFVRDRQTSQTTRVNVDSAGGQTNSYSGRHAISADGRYVAFYSSATNLVDNDTNGVDDVFVRDRKTGQTSRVSVDSAGKQGNYHSSHLSINADGRYVAFQSSADNLVIGDSNWREDIFVRDRLLQTSKSADISLALSGPTSAIKGSDAIYTFTVTNNGSINAANATLTGVISSRGRLKSIVPSQGECSPSAIPVCRLGTLTPGQSVTMTATVTINGNTSVKATAQAAPKDALRGNNAKSITTKLQ